MKENHIFKSMCPNFWLLYVLLLLSPGPHVAWTKFANKLQGCGSCTLHQNSSWSLVWLTRLSSPVRRARPSLNFNSALRAWKTLQICVSCTLPCPVTGTHTFPLLHLCPHALLQRIKSYCLRLEQISCCQRMSLSCHRLLMKRSQFMSWRVLSLSFKPVDQEDSHCSAKWGSLRDPCSAEPLSIFFSFHLLDLNKKKKKSMKPPFRKQNLELETSQLT